MIDDTMVSPDWVGTAREHVEEAIGGAPAMFVQGFCGDVNCHHIFGTPALARRNGERLGQAAAAAMPSACEVEAPPRPPVPLRLPLFARATGESVTFIARHSRAASAARAAPARGARNPAAPRRAAALRAATGSKLSPHAATRQSLYQARGRTSSVVTEAQLNEEEAREEEEGVRRDRVAAVASARNQQRLLDALSAPDAGTPCADPARNGREPSLSFYG